jgi:hypothetical protein
LAACAGTTCKNTRKRAEKLSRTQLARRLMDIQENLQEMITHFL